MYAVLPPQIIIHPTDVSAAAPFSGIFNCSARGYGYRNIIWNRKNNPLPKKAYSTLVQSVNNSASTLMIPNVTSKDVGIYYCVVQANGLEAHSKTAELSFAGRSNFNLYVYT